MSPLVTRAIKGQGATEQNRKGNNYALVGLQSSVRRRCELSIGGAVLDTDDAKPSMGGS